jgi:hypothetical protein
MSITVPASADATASPPPPSSWTSAAKATTSAPTANANASQPRKERFWLSTRPSVGAAGLNQQGPTAVRFGT